MNYTTFVFPEDGAGGREYGIKNKQTKFFGVGSRKQLLACFLLALAAGTPVWAANPLFNQASDASSIAIGSKTDSANSVTIGYNAKGGVNSTTIGTSGDANPTVGGIDSIIIGGNASTDNQSFAVSIGDNSTASTHGVALGAGANAGKGETVKKLRTDEDGDPVLDKNGNKIYDTITKYSEYDTAVGYEAKANCFSSSAFGHYSRAIGSYSTALGDSASALKYASTAVGNSAQASEWYSTAMGNDALAGGWGSTAIGYVVQATGSGSIAIGFGMHGPANSSGEDALALGSGAAASMDNSVALGAGSTTIYDFSAAQKTTMTLDGQTYKFAGTPFEDNGIVSVGSSGKERVLTNVAPGRISADSTDAINGSQLYGTNQALEALSKRTVKYDVKDGNVDTSNITLAGNGGTTITNVADTSITGDSTNAVNSRTVFNETRVSKDGTYIRKDNSAARNIEALDHQVALNGDSIVSLQSDIHSLGHRVNKVGAGAAALAGLHPLDFDPDDKWDFAASTGSYRNAHAFAVGAFYRPNEGTMFSLGGSFGNGENMWNAGVSLKLGRGSGDTSYSKTVMAREIVFLQDKVKAQDEKISSYETRLAAQDKELAELKDTVNRLSAALGVK